ncbi:hypothetical protein L195_g053549, partial [Trifolium pratense]
MDHHRQWRPNFNPIRPIQYQNNNNNLCPICFIQHFPFCPPPPPNPNIAYDSDFDRTFKKPRIQDDERRLKLIRDHGLNPNPPQFQHPHHAYVTPSLSSQPPPPPPPPHHQFPPPPPPPIYHPQQHHSEINATYHDHNFQFQPYPNHNHTNNQNLNSRELNHPYPYPNPYPNGGNNSFSDNSGQLEGSRFFTNMPPLPNSPPPPLPMDPPVNHFKTYFSPPKKPPSLFPVTSSVSHEPHHSHQLYFHNNKPHLP